MIKWLLVTLGASLSCLGAGIDLSVEATKDDVLPYEPIIIRVAAHNLTGRDVTIPALGPIGLDSYVEMAVVSAAGDTYRYRWAELSRDPESSIPYRVLEPGDSSVVLFNMGEKTGVCGRAAEEWTHLEPGMYSLICRWRWRALGRTDSSPSTWSEPHQFTVRQPSTHERAAGRLWGSLLFFKYVDYWNRFRQYWMPPGPARGDDENRRCARAAGSILRDYGDIDAYAAPATWWLASDELSRYLFCQNKASPAAVVLRDSAAALLRAFFVDYRESPFAEYWLWDDSRLDAAAGKGSHRALLESLKLRFPDSRVGRAATTLLQTKGGR